MDGATQVTFFDIAVRCLAVYMYNCALCRGTDELVALLPSPILFISYRRFASARRMQECSTTRLFLCSSDECECNDSNIQCTAHWILCTRKSWLIFDIVIINLVSMMRRRRRRRKNNSKRPGTLFIKHETQSICCQAKRDPRARPLKKIQINKCHRLAHNKLLASKSPQATLESIVWD